MADTGGAHALRLEAVVTAYLDTAAQRHYRVPTAAGLDAPRLAALARTLEQHAHRLAARLTAHHARVAAAHGLTLPARRPIA